MHQVNCQHYNTNPHPPEIPTHCRTYALQNLRTAGPVHCRATCSNLRTGALQIYDACTESDVLLPSYVVFEGTSGPISTLRLATFTGTRFFRSIFSQLEASSATTSAPRPSRRRPSHRSDHPRTCFRVSDWGNIMRLDGMSPETLDVLLRLMEGAAPSRLTLQQAGEVFGALDYCLAQNLSAVVAYYLGPMIAALAPKEVPPELFLLLIVLISEISTHDGFHLGGFPPPAYPEASMPEPATAGTACGALAAPLCMWCMHAVSGISTAAIVRGDDARHRCGGGTWPTIDRCDVHAPCGHLACMETPCCRWRGCWRDRCRTFQKPRWPTVR